MASLIFSWRQGFERVRIPMNIRLKAACLLCSLLNAGCSIASTDIAASNIASSTTALPSRLIGRWSPNCEEVGGINVRSKGRIIMEVNSNQIYIYSRGEFYENALTLFLGQPEDLGRGGMMLSWDEFSKIESIAKMELVSEDSTLVEWLGFYSEVSKSRVWVDEPDFVESGTKVFHKCSD